MNRRLIAGTLIVLGVLLGVTLPHSEKKYYRDFPSAAFAEPGQIPIIMRQSVNDYQCLPNPGNPPTGYVRVYCDSSTNQLAAINSSGSSVLTGGAGGAAIIFPANYGAKANVQRVKDASWTAGSNPTTITCPNNDCNFTSSDTGKSCFGIAGTSYLAAALGTFTFVSAQSGTCSGGVGVGSPVATGVFAWGTDDTTALVNATAALYALPHCGTLQLPAGAMFLTKGVGNTIPAACSTGIGGASPGGNFPGANTGVNIFGAGRTSTIILPTPGFDFSSCGSAGCFWNESGGNGAAGHDYKDFTIDGMGAALSGVSTSPATALFSVGPAGSLQNVGLFSWGSLATGTIRGITISNQGSYVKNFQITAWGSESNMMACGVGVSIESGFVGGRFSLTAGGTCTDYFGWYGGDNAANNIVMDITGTFYGYGTLLQGIGSNTAGIDMETNGVAKFFGMNCQGSGLATNAIGVLMHTGSSIYLQDSSLCGGTTGGATSGTAGTIYNLGGNTITAGPFLFSGTYVDLTGTGVQGACTGVATAASTLGLYGTGPNVTTTTCTSTTIGTGTLETHPGTVYALIATATAGGVNASSGVVTLLKNGSTTTLTCTIGTGTKCNDGAAAHQVTYAAGDRLSLQFTTQTAETLAGVQATAVVW